MLNIIEATRQEAIDPFYIFLVRLGLVTYVNVCVSICIYIYIYSMEGIAREHESFNIYCSHYSVDLTELADRLTEDCPHTTECMLDKFL